MIVILGPTATGKTVLAAELCYRINGEVISADSRQVYRDMDIGTGKDLDDFNIHNTQGNRTTWHNKSRRDLVRSFAAWDYLSQ